MSSFGACLRALSCWLKIQSCGPEAKRSWNAAKSSIKSLETVAGSARSHAFPMPCKYKGRAFSCNLFDQLFNLAMRRKLSIHTDASATGFPSKVSGCKPRVVAFWSILFCTQSKCVLVLCASFARSPFIVVRKLVNKALNSSFWSAFMIPDAGQTQILLVLCVSTNCP